MVVLFQQKFYRVAGVGEMREMESARATTKKQRLQNWFT
jgi:hypothetical protein